MNYKRLILFLIVPALFSCKKEKATIDLPPGPTMPNVLLKDIVISSLPAPYYHFEYDAAGKLNFVSYASELTRYNVVYEGSRVIEMRNNTLVNKDQIKYLYDLQGRVEMIAYTDSTGDIYARSRFTYEAGQLVKVERDHKAPGGFVVDRDLTLAYDDNGNLKERRDHRPAIDGQTEATFVDRFEEYDAGLNVDGFGLLHPDFFEHLFLLPGVTLQKNNPGKETRLGDGINYQVSYSYKYNDNNAPVTRDGEVVITNGANSGQRFKTSSTYTYYH
jgi:hypothetical protein